MFDHKEMRRSCTIWLVLLFMVSLALTVGFSAILIEFLAWPWPPALIASAMGATLIMLAALRRFIR